MAFLRDITRKCSLCSARATVELVNSRNGVLGSYCKRCGARALARQERDEQAAGLAARPW